MLLVLRSHHHYNCSSCLFPPRRRFLSSWIASSNLASAMGGVNSLAFKEPSSLSEETRASVLSLEEGEKPSLEAVARRIKSGASRRVVCLCGAGISVSCGIPDFRSEGTGLYHNLQKYDLDSPESIFDINFFRENPKPFIHLAKELFPGQFKPSPTHYFMRLLELKGILLRVYTQNIDGLEFQAGLSEEKVVQCHGGFQTSHCTNCQALCDNDKLKADIMAGRETYCESCSGLCKPGITFFGEALPSRYHELKCKDFARYSNICCFDECSKATLIRADGTRDYYCEIHSPHTCDNLVQNETPTCSSEAEVTDVKTKNETDVVNSFVADIGETSEENEDDASGEVVCDCDLLIVMGTSLAVAPVSGLADDVEWLCPRVLINREKVHEFGGEKPSWPPQFGPDNGFRFDSEDNYRDVACIMDCDDGIRRLAGLLGWEDELNELIYADSNN